MELKLSPIKTPDIVLSNLKSKMRPVAKFL